MRGAPGLNSGLHLGSGNGGVIMGGACGVPEARGNVPNTLCPLGGAVNSDSG